MQARLDVASPITFAHEELGGLNIVTSPQLPRWRCTGPTKAVALARCAASLKFYLRGCFDLPDEIRMAAEAWIED